MGEPALQRLQCRQGRTLARTSFSPPAAKTAARHMTGPEGCGSACWVSDPREPLCTGVQPVPG